LVAIVSPSIATLAGFGSSGRFGRRGRLEDPTDYSFQLRVLQVELILCSLLRRRIFGKSLYRVQEAVQA
jgi:hypothetical protein